MSTVLGMGSIHFIIHAFPPSFFHIWQVKIAQHVEHQIPFGVGMASDPMALRRGGKKLPMEDVCYYQWPLPGVEQVFMLQDKLWIYSYALLLETYHNNA